MRQTFTRSIRRRCRGEIGDDGAVLRRLLEENHSRSKTLEQKAREGKAWERVYRAEAAKRMAEAAERGRATQSGGPASSGRKPIRRATEDAAKAVGLGSASTYERAAKVVEVIDAATPDEAKALR